MLLRRSYESVTVSGRTSIKKYGAHFTGFSVFDLLLLEEEDIVDRSSAIGFKKQCVCVRVFSVKKILTRVEGGLRVQIRFQEAKRREEQEKKNKLEK
uniref:Uncharacterized protein n=1 Tax=Vespula pensylvanica TaxID=30213 RepID=A0A834PFQ3_VESPE|nr:hypothetical protein H0235_000717 [Vespula pensylvanica]